MKQVGFANLESRYDIVNIGSGPSLHDFDWSCVSEVKGYNFAVSPEDFRYDCRILRNFKNLIKENGTIIIVICPLSFAGNRFLLKDYYSYRYFDVLPQSEIILSNCKYRAYKNRIGRFFINNYYRMCSIPPLIYSVLGRRKEARRSSEEKLVRGWLRDNPELRNLKDLPKRDMTNVFEEKKKELKEIIEECKSANLRPVLLIPPISNKLHSYFSQEFLEAFVYNNIKEISDAVVLLDFLSDDTFGNDLFYSNGLFLKYEIASEFTREVLSRLGTI